MSKKIIITAAITGNIHVPSMSPYLPSTPKEIIDDSIRARDAGAAVTHIHAREEDGKPTTDLNIYGEILSGIKAKSDAVICVTTGGTANMTAEERISVVKEYKPEIASFNMGSLNFALYPAAEKIKEFKYDWEKPYLEGTESFIFPNNFTMLKEFCQAMKDNNTLPELEIYDTGMINNAAQLIREGYLEEPLYLQFVMGILGGIPASVENLIFLNSSCKNTFNNYISSVCAAGRHQFPMGVTNLFLGGNMRVGMEDNLYLEKGVLAKSNAEQVEKAVKLAEELGFEIATPEEAREILNLKGKDKVNF